METLVLATSNQDKVREIDEILSSVLPGVELVSLADALDAAGISNYVDPVEDGRTFHENALIKARAAVEPLGVPVIADDSGLVVDALGGAPGIYSARYAGEHGDNAANRKKVLAQMVDVADEDRSARFVCSVVYLDASGREIAAEGTIEGSIAREELGEGGFGYDPIFYAKDYPGLTTAQISEEQKNAISHRGNAFREFARKFVG